MRVGVDPLVKDRNGFHSSLVMGEGCLARYAEHMADTPSTNTAPPAPPALSKGQIFVRRLSSTVVLWTVVLTSIFSTNAFIREYVFLGLMMLLAWSGLSEFYGLVEKRGLVCFRGWGTFGGLLLMGSTFFYLTAYLRQNPVQSLMPAKANDFETSVLIVFVLGLCVRQFVAKNNTAGILAISTTLFGLMYVPWLLNFIQKITFFPGVDGRFYVLYFILVTKFSDLGAYVTGSLIGRHKMIPRISPGKTWEGFGGAVVIATLETRAKEPGNEALAALLAGELPPDESVRAGQIAALTGILPVQPATATGTRDMLLAAAEDYDLSDWLAACNRRLDTGAPACVLVVADLLPSVPGEEGVLILKRNPDYIEVMGLYLGADGSLTHRNMVRPDGSYMTNDEAEALLRAIQAEPLPTTPALLNQLGTGPTGLLMLP